jgi:peptidoglycan/LPS O-acetylase OafA/YrhL
MDFEARLRALGDRHRRLLVRRSLDGVTVDEFRPDVEGLRAVAVVAVVAFHADVTGFAGGFVGVDVFFVVSGFLISRLLLGELESSGSLSLPAFWARRARRLLPASCLVIVVTLFASRLAVAPAAVRAIGVDAVAAGGFVVNVVFAHRLGDYFVAQLGESAPSPLLHFWSLAVEEQFYLVWPAAMLALTRWPHRLRRNLVVLCGAVGAASIAASMWLTVHHPTWAFYLLPARAVELLAGALVALAGPAFGAVEPKLRAAAAWVGLAGIACAVLTYDQATAFPGTATLLPVAATVLVIVGGGPGTLRWSPSVVLHRPMLQWIGGHSYAIYLWHWPALVLVAARWGPLSIAQRAVVVAASIALAAVSRRALEDPVRSSAWLGALPRRGLVLGASLSAVAVLIGITTIVFRPPLSTREVAAAPDLALPIGGGTGGGTGTTVPAGESGSTAPPTADPASVLAALVEANRAVLEQGLAVQSVPANLRPSLAAVYDDRPAVYGDGCVNAGVDDELHTDCRYGTVGAATQVVLYGDSHAAQWFPPLDALGVVRGFELVVFTKGGCPTATVSIATNTLGRTCPRWRDRVVQWVAAHRPAMVIVTASSQYDNGDEQWAAGIDQTLSRLAPSTARLVVLADNPGAAANPQECLSAHLTDVQRCSNSRDRALEPGRIAGEQAAAGRLGATYVATTDWFCTATACPMILGDILLYRDADHLTTVGATWFQPLLEASIVPLLGQG